MDSIYGAWLGVSVDSGEPHGGSKDGIPHDHLIRGVGENVGKVGADQGSVPGLQVDGLSVDDHIHGAPLQQDDLLAGMDDRQSPSTLRGASSNRATRVWGTNSPMGMGDMI